MGGMVTLQSLITFYLEFNGGTMIEAKDGKWVTKDDQAFDDFNEAVLHKRDLIRQEAVAARCTNESQIKNFRKRYWVTRQREKKQKEKEGK